jgi:hypothetical protein
MNEAFEQWWAEKYAPAMSNLTGVLHATFKEVAKKAWEAGEHKGWNAGFEAGYDRAEFQ